MNNLLSHKKHVFFVLIIVIAITLFIFDLATASLSAADEVKQDVKVEGLVREIQADAVPDHVLLYDDALSPEWKLTWDLARQLYRDKKFREALVQYEILLSQKGTVNEARWEYASILLHLERWVQACDQLEQLLALDQDNKVYLFAMADASLKCGYTEKAIKIYTGLFEAAAGGPEARQALEGLVIAYEILGNLEATLPLLKQLLEIQPDDFALRKSYARLLLALGDYSKAEEVLGILEKQEPGDVGILWMQSRLLDKTGDSEGAAVCLQKTIGIDPENYEAHRELKKYYRSNNNLLMSLKHLEVMLSQTPGDAVLLEEAGQLSMQLGNIDAALDYYDECLYLAPENASVLGKKSDAQRILARDLLALVENDGSEKLWQDLVKVTADRPAIFREIAILLREKNQISELIEVLVLLYNENPEDEQTYQELAMLLEKNGRSNELKILQSKKISGAAVQ